MTPEYKIEKEAFVSHLGGGDIWEINYVTLVAPAAALLWSILQSRQSFFTPYKLPVAFVDILLHCCAILFATTVYASAPQVLNGLILLPTVATLLQPAAKTEQPSDSSTRTAVKGAVPASTQDAEANDLDNLPVKPFITTYRGAMMIVTCCSILAVDFPVFPRRFAKTESFGTSLMDMGVGSFVFAAGIVAARQQLKEKHSAVSSLFTRLRNAMRHSLPLLALGLIRLYSVKGLEYAEHVSEYGVHWNFFFTLALLPITTAILQPLLRIVPSLGLLAFVLAIAYELVLYLPDDMKRWIILGERVPGDFLSQNREGIFSFAGYFCIFLGGMGMGTGVLPRDPDADENRLKIPEKDSMDEDAEWLSSVLGGAEEEKPIDPMKQLVNLKPQLPKSALIHLLKWTAIWFIVSVWAMWRYGPRLFVSRRMANLAYIVWVCAFNSAQLLLFKVIESIMFPHLYESKDKQTERRRVDEATSKVMRAFNRNGLALFLLANLLTGAINMSINTIHVTDTIAMVILVGYIGIISIVALVLDHYNVSIKL